MGNEFEKDLSITEIQACKQALEGNRRELRKTVL